MSALISHEAHDFKEPWGEDHFLRTTLLAEVVRKLLYDIANGKSIDKKSARLADILILTIGIADSLGIDLVEAFNHEAKKLGSRM